MTFKQHLFAFEKAALCIIRKWWRPVTCVWLSLTMAAHGFVLPMYALLAHGDTMTDLSGLSMLVTAIAAAFAVRTYEKTKGLAADGA